MNKLFALVLLSAVSASVVGQATHGINSSLPEQTIRLSTGIELAYVEHGDPDGTPLILLHGFTDSWRSFEEVLPLFSKPYHVFAVTQRGHGNSSKPAEIKLSLMADDIADFIRLKNLPPCIIAGHSLGGLVTQQLALSYPELTRAVIIVSSEAKFSDNIGMSEFIAELKTLHDPIDYAFADAFQKSTITKPIDPERLKLLVGESMKVPAHVWAAVGSELESADFTDRLHLIKVPSLILWGTLDSVCPENDQHIFAAAFPHGKFVVYEGTGHALHWEDGDRFVRDVSQFLGASLNAH